MRTILIVDDDKKYRDLLADELKKDEFNVLSAENGEEGLIIAGKYEVDLILLDLLMPKVDGVTFFNKLKTVLKKHVPVIVLTNISDTAAYDNDIKDILIKSSVSLEEVVKKVKKALN